MALGKIMNISKTEREYNKTEFEELICVMVYV